MSVKATTRFLRALCAAAGLAWTACHAWAAQPAAQEGDTYGKILETLDTVSPSDPDTKNLAALFHLRAAVGDEEIRDKITTLVAAGFIAADRHELYRRHIRPVLRDPASFESNAQNICPVCNGAKTTSAKCGRCGGNGLCRNCKGAGKRRVNAQMTTLKGPSSAHRRQDDQFKEIPCATCKGTGACPDCDGTGTKKSDCGRCGGSGKVWDPAAVNAVARESHDALHALIKLKTFETSTSASVAVAKADGTRLFAPVFSFNGARVAALPARAVTGISSVSLRTCDEHPLPFTSILASTKRDLVLLDLGSSSLVPPLELETDALMLGPGRHIYAYGSSRENGTALRLHGKVTVSGPSHLATTLDSKLLSDCTSLISDSGRLGGLFMFPMAEFNTFGAISLTQDNGAALRLNDIQPSEFITISADDLNLRNNTLCSAKGALKTAEELLACTPSDLATKKSSVSETVKRLDRSIAMLKEVPKWELFMMEATAKELMVDCETRARNLERRLADIARMKPETKDKDGELADETEAIDEQKVSDDAPGETASATANKPAASPSRVGKAAKKRAADSAGTGEDDANGAIGLSRFDLYKILKIVAAAVVAITVIFILIGAIQDSQRKKKLSVPPKIPDFIREMQEYERKHPGKTK